MKPITQEEPMGCAIACVAFLLNTSYRVAKNMFKYPEHSFTRGFYCGEITNVLNKGGLNYTFYKFKKEHQKIINMSGVMVFTERNKNYPSGHFLVKTKNGWMNPWINFPHIVPSKSGFQKTLPGNIQWIIYPKNKVINLNKK